jgi:hypothetical protein
VRSAHADSLLDAIEARQQYILEELLSSSSIGR